MRPRHPSHADKIFVLALGQGALPEWGFSEPGLRHTLYFRREIARNEVHGLIHFPLRVCFVIR